MLFGVLTAAVAVSAPSQPMPPSRPAGSFGPTWPGTPATPVGPKVIKLPAPPARTAVPPGHTPLRNVSVSVRVIRDPRVIPETTPPIAFSLSQNYPNPFRGSTTIRYSLARSSVCRIAVYSITGQRVATLVDGPANAGEYSLQWNGANDSGGRARAGLYFYRIAAGSFMTTRKLIIR